MRIPALVTLVLAAALAAVSIPAAAQAATTTAPPMAFLDLDGQPASLAAVVGDRPTLLVFLRHFG